MLAFQPRWKQTGTELNRNLLSQNTDVKGATRSLKLCLPSLDVSSTDVCRDATLFGSKVWV